MPPCTTAILLPWRGSLTVSLGGACRCGRAVRHQDSKRWALLTRFLISPPLWRCATSRSKSISDTFHWNGDEFSKLARDLFSEWATGFAELVVRFDRARR